jgi:hypothetical protein
MEQTMRLIGYVLETEDKCYLVWKNIGDNWGGYHKADSRDLPFIFNTKEEKFARDLADNGALKNQFGKIKVVELFARESQ